jgi:hypothetical protein
VVRGGHSPRWAAESDKKKNNNNLTLAITRLRLLENDAAALKHVGELSIYFIYIFIYTYMLCICWCG